jgi:hypothetical protein
MLQARALPVYTYGEREYFVDFRLQELRPIDAPHENIQFITLCEDDIKEDLRGIRAEFGPCCYIPGLDD